jgi:rsbT co-antagonist protein RsbR
VSFEERRASRPDNLIALDTTMPATRLPELIKQHEKEVLAEWMRSQLAATTLRSDLLKETDLHEQSRHFLAAVQAAVQHGGTGDITGEPWAGAREALRSISRTRAQQGFTPSETATFVFSLKEPLFSLLRRQVKSADALADEMWTVTLLLDKLGLHTVEAYLASREDLIRSQQGDLLELSTPVVQLWDDILALPLVGTLDSARAQVVMETLLQKVVETEASIAIIDITGVPTVDTLVAQHLIKTVSATRLMGADCIISGIRPQIAQTIVHLGVNLGEVITKATLADAFAVALKRTGATIARNGEANGAGRS